MSPDISRCQGSVPLHNNPGVLGQRAQPVHAEFLRRGMGPAAGLAPFTEALLQARRLSGQSACCRACQTRCLPSARAASFEPRVRQHQRRCARARRRHVKHTTVSAFSSGLQGVPPSSGLISNICTKASPALCTLRKHQRWLLSECTRRLRTSHKACDAHRPLASQHSTANT